jgi:osmotically-inducible protein OsmY
MIKKYVLFLPLCLSGCGAFLVGGAGTVGMSAVEDRGLTGVIGDRALQIRVNMALSDELSDFSGISTTIYKGRVLLTGVAANEKVKKDAVSITRRVWGVTEVIDGMNVKGEDGFAEYARDAWMTTKLKASLYADQEVIAPNYLVTTFDRVIYVFGTAETREEMQRVINSAYEITGVRRVVNLIEVKRTPQK